jgi:hypothetical protein
MKMMTMNAMEKTRSFAESCFGFVASPHCSYFHIQPYSTNL